MYAKKNLHFVSFLPATTSSSFFSRPIKNLFATNKKIFSHPSRNLLSTYKKFSHNLQEISSQTTRNLLATLKKSTGCHRNTPPFVIQIIVSFHKFRFIPNIALISQKLRFMYSPAAFRRQYEEIKLCVYSGPWTL